MKHIGPMSILIGAIGAIGAANLALATESSMRAGQWEVTTQTEMEGMPMQMPATKDLSCITAEEIQKPFMAEQEPGCTLDVLERTANTHKWKIACTENGEKMTGVGDFQFTAETYNGVIEMSMTEGGQTMKMKTRLQGKRVGDC